MKYGFEGTVALITGGARGIGYATGRLLAQEGAKVALADIDGCAVAAAAERLAGETGATTLAITADIAQIDEVERMAGEAEAALGPLAVVINSAAVLDDKLFVESGPEDWRRMIDICLYGPMNVIRTVVPGMAERGYGRIVCLASDAARIGQARLSYYAAAKAGVIALVKSVAQEMGRSGVTLNIVSPGATNTELRREREARLRAAMGEERYAKRTRNVLRLYPTGRLGEPEDIAAAIAFLASRQAGWITGQVMSVNGGFVMP